MDSINLINRVKYSKRLYWLYFKIGSFAVNILKIFLKPDDKLIVFNSFGGRKYDDSPKAIYEAMLKDSRFNDYKLVWAFRNPDLFRVERGYKVKIDTFYYYKVVLKARVWITNTTMTRALRFSGINTFNMNTWHGTAIKKIGSDTLAQSSTFRSSGGSTPDCYLAQSQYDVEVFSHAFHVPSSKVKVIGLPRNDDLSKIDLNRKMCLRDKLRIPLNKTVILYAPTFRDYINKGDTDAVNISPVNIEKWKFCLGENYLLLIRAHHASIEKLNISDNDFVKDVSAYPNLNDLMIISDMLISDYSSIFFDYSIMNKPMLCYSYDYEKFAKDRGVYFDIRQWLPFADDEETLLQLIKKTDATKESEETNSFRKQFVTEYGNASNKAVDIIFHEIL